MMVGNSFDLWQKDVFFSAAEEVQESADMWLLCECRFCTTSIVLGGISVRKTEMRNLFAKSWRKIVTGRRMESAYRMWLKERKQGLTTTDSAERCRELQAALGTAKWQLEEFERGTSLSHGHLYDDITATRHKQFIAAIEHQISRVEAALKEAFIEEGKQPLSWVNLDQEERDDLAMFLSGTSPSFQPSAKGTHLESCHKGKDADYDTSAVCNGDILEMKNYIDAECIIEVKDEGSFGRIDNISCQLEKATSTRRTWSSPNFDSLKIVIDDKYEDRDEVTEGIEATPKGKCPKPFFWKQRCREHSQTKGALNLLNQTFGHVGGSQRQLQSPVHLQLRCSLQFTLALMIAIFLIVPFVIHLS